MTNLPTFEQLLEAQRRARGEGLGSTISRGISEGQTLASQLAKQQQEVEQKKQEFQLKVKEALGTEQKEASNVIPGNLSPTGQPVSPEVYKTLNPQSPWKVLPGVLSKGNKPIEYNPLTNEAREMGMVVGNQKEDDQQERLKREAMSRINTLRGDASLARIESQRDASIAAYNTISTIKNENREPSQVEYYDILGQLWKARTGAAPTDQAIRDLDTKTFKGNLAKMGQYFTGKPTGITTRAVLDNIQDFADVSGKQSDKLHEGYMVPHKYLSSGLTEESKKEIQGFARGLSYEEATKELRSNQNIPGTKRQIGKYIVEAE